MVRQLHQLPASAFVRGLDEHGAKPARLLSPQTSGWFANSISFRPLRSSGADVTPAPAPTTVVARAGEFENAPHARKRLESRQGSRLRLTDSRDGIETVEARAVWPERRVFAACLSHVFEESAPKVAELLERHKAALRQGPNRLDRIKRTIGYWGRQQHEMAPGMPFTFGALVDSASASFPSLKSVAGPIYVFDQSGSKTDTRNDRGLTKHGPYTAQVFTPHQPTICVVCQQSVKGQVEQFLDKFNQGIKLPPPRDPAERQTNYFEKGFCRKYALPDIQYEFFLAESSSVDSYKKACQRAIEEHGSGRKWDRESAHLLAESFYERSEITSLLPRRLSIVAVLQVGLCDALASLWGARAAAFAPVQAAAPFVMPGC